MRNKNHSGRSQRKRHSNQGWSSNVKTLIAIGLVVVVGIVTWLSWPAAEYSLPYQGKVRDVQNGNIIMDNGLTVEVLAANVTTDGENFMRSQIVGKEVRLIADSHDTNPKYKNPTKDKVRAYVEVIDGAPEYKDLNAYLVKDARYAKLSSAYCQDRYTEYQKMLEANPDEYQDLDGSRSVEPFKPNSLFDKTALFRYMAPATFLIVEDYGPDGNGEPRTSIGTGFFINKNGVALTNYHVLSGYISGRAKATIFLCDENGNITIDRDRPIHRYIAADKKKDWCVFVVGLDNNEQSPYLNLSKVQAKQGVDVGVLGNPKGETATFTVGMISNIHENRGEIQFDASMYPGNSGGPVCNFYGEVLGIAKSVAGDGRGGIATGNMNYGVDIMLVRKALDEMKDITYYGGK